MYIKSPLSTQYLGVFGNMQSAALGLTCKEAFTVFSQNATLALQHEVVELQALLAPHKPAIAHTKMFPVELLNTIRIAFDKEFPAASRYAPIRHNDQAADPFHQVDGCLWSGFTYLEILGPRESLRTIIKRVLQEALGKATAAYCAIQSYKAIRSVRHALLGGYMAAGWTIFSVQHKQEYIVWQALLDHFEEMKDDLADDSKYQSI